MSLNIQAVLDKYNKWDGVDKPCYLVVLPELLQEASAIPQFRDFGIEILSASDYILGYGINDDGWVLGAREPADKELYANGLPDGSEICIYCRHWRRKPWIEPCPNCRAITN